jgi:hypothetical protein
LLISRLPATAVSVVMASTDTISQKRDLRIPKSKSKRMVGYLVVEHAIGHCRFSSHRRP